MTDRRSSLQSARLQGSARCSARETESASRCSRCVNTSARTQKCTCNARDVGTPKNLLLLPADEHTIYEAPIRPWINFNNPESYFAVSAVGNNIYAHSSQVRFARNYVTPVGRDLRDSSRAPGVAGIAHFHVGNNGRGGSDSVRSRQLNFLATTRDTQSRESESGEAETAH